jgi:hypothetical protein
MTPRRKPIPSPIARPSDVGLSARPLAPTRVRSMLPTVAALLALGAIGCDDRTEAIARDNVMSASLTQLAQQTPAPRSTTEQDPTAPLPGMGALEDPVPQPTPPPPAPTVVAPPKHPYPVKGGMKAVHPVPTAIPMPGGPKAVAPPIAPKPKAPKLGGDVAAVVPETT